MEYVFFVIVIGECCVFCWLFCIVVVVVVFDLFLDVFGGIE